jgi:hypothetical protein
MLTPYKSSDMLFKYSWIAGADHDNPKIIAGADHTQLNRNEGYEMIYFITSLVKTLGGDGYPLRTYQNIEKIIKLEVPDTIRTHSGIMEWISSHYDHV